MTGTWRLGFALLTGLAGLAGCASVEDVVTKSSDLGEGKQEFETSAQGGTYRFEYVTHGSDGYRTVFWRQGVSLSDDTADQKLATNVVRSVFGQRFCKEMKLPATLADGSPEPLGAGLWRASLRCAAPAPEPKKASPEKKPKKKAPAAAAETVSEVKPKTESAPDGAKPKKKTSSAALDYDGPMECTRTATGFDCKPKR